jgi:hypothetical protein
MRTGDWIVTYTSKQFYITDPHPDDVDIIDIAHALSMLCRYGGHSAKFYSVAQHSVEVFRTTQRLCDDPEVHIWGADARCDGGLYRGYGPPAEADAARVFRAGI